MGGSNMGHLLSFYKQLSVEYWILYSRENTWVIFDLCKCVRSLNKDWIIHEYQTKTCLSYYKVKLINPFGMSSNRCGNQLTNSL
jgi:hypothetical protein